MIGRKQAETLIRQYFQSWLVQDLEILLGTVTDDIHITESYGPVYAGIDEVHQWFVNWHTGDGKGKVTRWDILRMLFDEDRQSAAVEWDFECIYEGNEAGFLGASLFHFAEGKINSIKEFQMERKQYRPYADHCGR